MLDEKRKAVLHVFPTPFAIFQREKFDVVLQDGETVEQLAKRIYPKVKFNHFAIRTKHVKPDAVVKDGDEVIAWAVPEGEVVAAFAAIGAELAIVGKALLTIAWIGSVVYSIYSFVQSRKLAKGAKNSSYGKPVEDTSDTNYGWDFDASNPVTEGAPLPVLYGKRQVIPPVIQQRITVTNTTKSEYLEMIVGVAQGGAGFADSISYPLNENGEIDILLNHTNWKNYISKTQFVDDSSETINRLTSSNTIYNGVYYENGTLSYYSPAQTGNLTDGDTATKATNLAESQSYDSRNSPGKSGTGGSKYTRNFYFVLTKKCKITEVRFFISTRKVTFNVYAGNSTNITEFKRIGTFSGNGTKNSWKVCRCNTEGKFYQYVLITDFTGGQDERIYSKDGTKLLEINYAYYYEIAVYGSMNADVTEGYTGYAEVDLRPGTYNQEPMTICNGVWAALTVNKGLNTSWFTFPTSTGASPEMLAITLEFPYGLYDLSNSIMETKSVSIACEYRTIDSAGTAGTWTKFNSSFDSNSTLVISDATTSPKKVQLQTDENTLTGYDHYEIRIKFAADPQLSDTVQGACNWTILEEGYSHKPSYPRTACAAVKMLATENLSGGTPQVKVMAERQYVMVYNSITEKWNAKPANNPAWAAYDVLVRPIFDDTTAPTIITDEDGYVISIFNEESGTFEIDLSPYLREEAFPHERVKYSDFEEWAEFCDEEQITMSMYFDGTSSVTDCLQYLCDIGRAGIVNRGNVIGVVVDRSAVNMDNLNCPVPLFKFDDSNVVADTYSENYSDRSNFPTEVQVTYFDREREYSRKSVIVRNDDSIVNHNTKDITLYACDDRDIALRHAEYILNMNLIKKGYAWTGDLDSMPLDMGDLVSIYGNLATITGVTFDEEMRRQFTAVNYSHERFGWEITVILPWTTIHALQFAIAGITFAELYTIDGTTVIGNSVYQIICSSEGVISTTTMNAAADTWEANACYVVNPLMDKGDINIYEKPANYPASISLQAGYNILCLSYDIDDYELIYSYHNGIDYASKVAFEKKITWNGEVLVESDISVDTYGKINLQTGVAYKVSATEAIDFPMFPPE